MEATIDTGFDDFLTVTPHLAAALQMPYPMTRDYELGDGSIVPFDVHWARVSWDGQDRLVEALVTDGGVLVGMAMLRGYTLYADVVDGGEVRIEPRT